MNRYQNTRVIRNSQNVSYYRTVQYPEVPLSINDIYVISADGDRFDLLANQYYGDSTLWWIISIANPDAFQNSLYLPLETQIRIPSDISGIISSYNALNS